MNNVNKTSRSSRQRLPQRRRSETFELEVSGLRYTTTVGYFSDGRIGEIFLQNHKPGSQSDANARDAAVAASLALQYGCPPFHTARRCCRCHYGGIDVLTAASTANAREFWRAESQRLGSDWIGLAEVVSGILYRLAATSSSWRSPCH